MYNKFIHTVISITYIIQQHIIQILISKQWVSQLYHYMMHVDK